MLALSVDRRTITRRSIHSSTHQEALMKVYSMVLALSLLIETFRARLPESQLVAHTVSSSASIFAQGPRRFEFRGLQLRDALTNDSESAQDLDCKDDPDGGEGIETCSSMTNQLAGVPVMLYVDIIDRKLAAFTFAFDADAFPKIVDAFRAQWGAPISVTLSKVHNAMNASFNNVVAKWRFADGVLQATQYGSNLSTSTVSVGDPRLSATMQRRRDCAKARTMVRDFGASAKLPVGCTAVTSRTRSGTARSTADQTYFAFQVDEPAMVEPNSPPPSSPNLLKSAGVEGDVITTFVVDTTGIADASSLKVLSSAHELFTAAVVSTLPKMRFHPAVVGGKKVRQLVQR